MNIPFQTRTAGVEFLFHLVGNLVGDAIDFRFLNRTIRQAIMSMMIGSHPDFIVIQTVDIADIFLDQQIAEDAEINFVKYPRLTHLPAPL